MGTMPDRTFGRDHSFGKILVSHFHAFPTQHQFHFKNTDSCRVVLCVRMVYPNDEMITSAKFKALLLPRLMALPLLCSFWPPSIPFCNTFLWLTHKCPRFRSCQSFLVPITSTPAVTSSHSAPSPSPSMCTPLEIYKEIYLATRKTVYSITVLC